MIPLNSNFILPGFQYFQPHNGPAIRWAGCREYPPPVLSLSVGGSPADAPMPGMLQKVD